MINALHKILIACVFAACFQLVLPLGFGGRLGDSPADGDDVPFQAGDGPSFEDYASVAEELSMIAETQLSFSRIRDGIVALVSTIPSLPSQIVEILKNNSPNGSADYFLGLILWVLFFQLLAGLIQHYVYGKWLVQPRFDALKEEKPQGILEKLPLLSLRAALRIVGHIMFCALAALGAVLFLDPVDDASQITVLLAVLTVFAIRATAVIWRMVLAPTLNEYRMPCMADRDARPLFVWLAVTTTISVSLLVFSYWLKELSPAWSQHNALLLVITGLTAVVNIAMVFANRRAVTSAFIAECSPTETNWFQRVSAALWVPLSVSYFLGAFLILGYRVLTNTEVGYPLIVSAYSILIAILAAYGGTAYIIARIFSHGRKLIAQRQQARLDDAYEDEHEALTSQRIITAQKIEGDPLDDDDDDDEGGPAGSFGHLSKEAVSARARSMRDFEGLARRTASLIALGVGIYALLTAWGFETVLHEGGMLAPVKDVVDTLLVGYVLYHAVRIWIDTRIEEEGGDDVHVEPGDEGGGLASASRLATLLPLFRNFMLVVISITVLLLVMLEMGVNVGPLFAGAGVLGLALGFGAQALIRDILSGVFFLIDDAFRKGEYIDIGSVKGTVEKISMRSFQLRHHLGALHTVPFGEIRLGDDETAAARDLRHRCRQGAQAGQEPWQGAAGTSAGRA